MARQKDVYSALERKEMPLAYLMLAPAFVCLSLFVIIPVIMAAQKSLYEWSFYTESVYVGFNNFRIILVNEFFITAITNVLKFVVVLVPLSLMTTFAFALTLKRLSPRATNLVKSAIYVPGIIAGIIISTVFSVVYNYRAGLLNQLIMSLGGKRVAFLNHPVWSFWSVVLTTLWSGLGGGTILMYAALMSIPDTYYEAAAIDGAGPFRRMLHITIPQMKNILILQTISGVSGTLQMLEMPMFLTGGGPLNKTLTPMLYIYNNFRDRTKTMGYTIAGALLILIVIALINSFVFALVRSEKSLDG